MYPRFEFCHLPTKIEELPRLSNYFGGPEILIKRDDQTGLAFGGNKTRKLEYLVGAALEEGTRTLITTGAAQSNHCRQTAAAAARCGLDCVLLLVEPEPETTTGNLFLDRLLGAEIRWTELSRRDETLKVVFKDLQERGADPYLIPYGGSNSIGAYAYYQAFNEIAQQLKNDLPDWIVFPSSSGGTQAGLVLGANQKSKTRILGISVDQSEDDLQQRVYGILRSLQEEIGDRSSITQDKILVNSDYIGDGYGLMTDGDKEAIRLFAEKEGVLLDPVYTGRAAAGLIDLIEIGTFKAGERVLFWHTGGTPGLFADRYFPDLI